MSTFHTAGSLLCFKAVTVVCIYKILCYLSICVYDNISYTKAQIYIGQHPYCQQDKVLQKLQIVFSKIKTGKHLFKNCVL